MMQAFVVLSCLLVSQLVVASPVEDISGLEAHPSLGDLLNRLTGPSERRTRDVDNGENSEDVCYDTESEKIREMLRYLDKNRNQLSKLLDESSCRSKKEEAASEGGFIDPQQRLAEIQSAIHQLLSPDGDSPEPLLAELADALLSGDALANLSNDSWRSPAETESREECWIDYAGFVEPITDSIARGIINSYCANMTRQEREQCELKAAPIIIEYFNATKPDWGRRMIDAMAKIPTTLHEGPLSWVGAYDLCLDTTITYFHNETAAERTFNGKYCRLDLTTIPNVVNGTASRTLTLQFGVCVPDTCNSQDVRWYINENNTVLTQFIRVVLGMELTYVYCGMEELDAATDPHLQAALAITLLFVAIVVIATIYDGCFRKSIMKRHVKELSEHVKKDIAGTKKDREDLLDEEPLKIKMVNRLEMCFTGFSAYTNFRKVFTIRDKPGDIPVLNGIRYLSYVYVMWGEIYVLGPIYFESWTTSNILGAVPRITKEFLFQPIINFHLSEDSFLLISGILVTYWFLRRYEANNNKLSWKSIVYYFLHRYWRLMPVLMLSIMIFTCTYKYAADGPMFPPKDTDGENCRVNWWVDLLMVHNIVKVHEQCFGHAWFVPLVFQLHLAAIVVVIPLVFLMTLRDKVILVALLFYPCLGLALLDCKQFQSNQSGYIRKLSSSKPVVGYVMIGVMYVAHIGATAGIASDLRKNRMGDWYNEYLLTPWCRAGPFIIGLAFGIIFHKRSKKGIKMHWAVSLCLWLVSLVCVLLPAFASYSEYKDGGERWSDDALIAYDTLARSSWALGLGWIALACHFDHGGVIDSFLSWKAWVPLSRLVYTTLLMHALFIMQFVYTSRLPIYIETYHMYYTLFAHLIYIMIIGLVVSLIWDLPLGTGVEKCIIAKTKFQWIRAGRHPRSDLNAAERRFWNPNESIPSTTEGQTMSGGKPVIPGCQYVEVSPADLKNLGLTIRAGTDDGQHAGNHHDNEKNMVGYTNLVFEKDDEPKPDYDVLENQYEGVNF